jgi:hypothetical protein
MRRTGPGFACCGVLFHACHWSAVQPPDRQKAMNASLGAPTGGGWLSEAKPGGANCAAVVPPNYRPSAAGAARQQ